MADEHFQFDNDKLKLAAFKLLLQNNALLKSIESSIARLLAIAVSIPPYPGTVSETVEEDREKYHALLKGQTGLYEITSLNEISEWAALNNPEMDDMIKKLFE